MSKWTIALTLVLLLAATAYAGPEPTGPWHPEIDYHPRLLFDATDLPDIQARLDREPYLTLMARIRSRANGSFSPTPPDPYSPGREYGLANIAKAAAFVAWIDDDEAMAEKAAQTLEAMAPDFGGEMLMLIDSSIHVAEAVDGFCYAYDILAGTGFIDSTRLDAIAELLGGMVAVWYDQFVDKLAFAADYHKNNHGSKMGAAFAAAAMTLNQRDDANKWFHYGMSRAYTVVFDIQTTENGAVAEGPYYSDYSAVNHLPVWVSYHRLVGGPSTLQRRGLCLIGPNCPWNDYDILDPIEHPKQYETSLWMVKARMPNGAPPPMDDGGIEGYPSGVVSSFYGDDGSLLTWEWVNNHHSPLFTTHCSELNVEAVALYDDAVSPPVGPAADFGPNFIMPDDGYAFFRSGWDEDDTWALLLAERGQARKAGGGHEHSDNLSVSLFARGEYLLLDPGYIAWEEHEKVRRSEHHNLPTADGAGPPNFIDVLGFDPGVDGLIVDSMDEGPAPFVTATSEWSDTAFTRTMMLPDTDYLIVIDDMQSDTVHHYGVLWHGQAGGDSGFPFSQFADGGRWAPGDAAVDVRIASSVGPTLGETLTNIHSFSWMQMIEHTSLDTRAVLPTEQARFISIAAPYAQAKELPRQVTWLADTGRIAARVEGEETDFVMAQDDNVAVEYTAEETGSIAMATSARTVVMRAADDASSGWAYLDGDGAFRAAGRLWGFLGAGRVWLSWQDNLWTIELLNPDAQVLTRFTIPPMVEHSGDFLVDRRRGLLRLNAQGGNIVRVDFRAVP
jgi:Heparinase II/III-like protein